MSFKENLLKKIEIDRLASKVIASCGSEGSRRPIDKEAMRRLLQLGPYTSRRERDLELYVKELDGELKMVLVLDNQLPIFRSTIQDVVTRRSPRTLELWSIRTIKNILVDSDIKLSDGSKSVETVQRDTVKQLDLTYTNEDIENLAMEGLSGLAGANATTVIQTLTLFAELLGYRKPPRSFKLEDTVCYGILASEPERDPVLGPLVLYRPGDNTLAWINEPLSRSDRQQREFLCVVAAGKESVPVSGDAVFLKLQENVLGRPERVLQV